MNLIGTCEGYFPTSTDLYLRGNNPARFQTTNSYDIKFDSGQITFTNTNAPLNNNLNDVIYCQRDLAGFNYLNAEINTIDLGNYGTALLMYVSSKLSTDMEVLVSYKNAGATTVSLNISAVNGIRYIILSASVKLMNLYRVWLS